ncbi:MAG TPA: hypothetical protein VN706_00020 [Gemmatimonadaceae bacterium]|nr:hypothetical protein [Gemmatimonadaceae bacterium]
MPDRDWDKELAKIDKQLGSLKDEDLLGPAQPQLPAKAGAAPAKAAKPAKASSNAPVERTTKSWAVYARLTISVLLGVAMVVWPYPSRCGAGLAGYLAAVVVVVTSGVWSAVWTWRHRASHAHILSLLLILWGLVLGSIEVLPRIGYAKPDARHPGNWSCQAPVPPAPLHPTG